MILKPVLTEKSFALVGLDQYTFLVDPKSNKNQIRETIEKLFNVNVLDISTIKSKTRLVRATRSRHYVNDRGMKKAIVKLKSGQKISLFNV